MSEEDKELEMLKAKRLAEMQKNFSEQDQLNDDTNNENEKPKPTLRDYVVNSCLLYTSPSPRDRTRSRMPSSA